MARVQELTGRLEDLEDGACRELAEELTGAVVQMYGAGLERIVELIEDEETRDRLASDELVAGLLMIHDLYPVPIEERVTAALDSVRPYMESHGGNIELLGFEDGVVKLRLEGSCKSCRASSSTLELAVRQALQEAAPDLLGMDVEGVVEEEPGGGSRAFRCRSSNGAPSWHTLEIAAARGPHGHGRRRDVTRRRKRGWNAARLSRRGARAVARRWRRGTLDQRRARLPVLRPQVLPATGGPLDGRRASPARARSRSCARPRKSGWRCEAAGRGRGQPAAGARWCRACAGSRSRSRRTRAEQLGPDEHCDLCNTTVPPDHRHMLNLVRAPDRVRLRELLGAPLGRRRSSGRPGAARCGWRTSSCPRSCGRSSGSRSGSRSSCTRRSRTASSRCTRARRARPRASSTSRPGAGSSR